MCTPHTTVSWTYFISRFIWTTAHRTRRGGGSQSAVSRSSHCQYIAKQYSLTLKPGERCCDTDLEQRMLFPFESQHSTLSVHCAEASGEAKATYSILQLESRPLLRYLWNPKFQIITVVRGLLTSGILNPLL